MHAADMHVCLIQEMQACRRAVSQEDRSRKALTIISRDSAIVHGLVQCLSVDSQ